MLHVSGCVNFDHKLFCRPALANQTKPCILSSCEQLWWGSVFGGQVTMVTDTAIGMVTKLSSGLYSKDPLMWSGTSNNWCIWNWTLYSLLYNTGRQLIQGTSVCLCVLVSECVCVSRGESWAWLQSVCAASTRIAAEGEREWMKERDPVIVK